MELLEGETWSIGDKGRADRKREDGDDDRLALIRRSAGIVHGDLKPVHHVTKSAAKCSTLD